MDRICKLCRITFDFKGGSLLCSLSCQDVYERLRNNLYSRTVAPAKSTVDRLETQTRIAKEEHRTAVSTHNAFCQSDNPLKFLIETLDDDTYRAVVKEIGDDVLASTENSD